MRVILLQFTYGQLWRNPQSLLPLLHRRATGSCHRTQEKVQGMLSRYRLKAPMSAILDKPGGQNVSVTIPVGAMLLDSLHTSTTLLGMVGGGVYWKGLHYSVFLDDLLKSAEIVQSA